MGEWSIAQKADWLVRNKYIRSDSVEQIDDDCILYLIDLARADDIDWVTIKGTHVPLDDDGNITGEVAEKIKSTAKKSTSEWKSKNDQARKEHLGRDKAGKARDLCDLYGVEHGDPKYKEIVSAFRNGTIDEEINKYYDLLDRNGDPMPTKKTVGMTKGFSAMVDTEFGGDWSRARRAEFDKRSGLTGEDADKAFSALETWVSNSWTHADKSALDSYVENAPAYDGEIFRGLHFDFGTDAFEKFISNVEVGGTMKMLGPSSWTSSESMARVFSHQGDSTVDSVVIRCRKNRTATPIDFINTQGEEEVLSPSSAAWTILDVQRYQDGGAKKAIITVVEKGER